MVFFSHDFVLVRLLLQISVENQENYRVICNNCNIIMAWPSLLYLSNLKSALYLLFIHGRKVSETTPTSLDTTPKALMFAASRRL